MSGILAVIRQNKLGITVVLVVMMIVALPLTASAQSANVQGVIDTLLNKYRSAGQTWTGTIQNAATNLFWLLATISLGWTCVSMAIKQSDLVEIVAELCRFIMFTGLFLWLLTNGAAYGNDIIQSLSQLGTNAGGQGLTPGDIVNLAMQ